MIQHHGDFAVLPYPAAWAAPKFQLGTTILIDGKPCQVVGLEYQTEETRPTGSDLENGWWVMYSYQRWVRGKRIVDVQSSHESVIQAMPCDVLEYDECRVAV